MHTNYTSYEKMKPSHFYLYIFMMDFSGRYNQKEKPRLLTTLGHNLKDISTHITITCHPPSISVGYSQKKRQLSTPHVAITPILVCLAVVVATSPESLHLGGRGPTKTLE